MSAKIHVPSESVWRFFCKNISKMQASLVKIAEDDETKIAVYLTEECNYPCFYVYKEDEECVYEELATSGADCEFVASEIYREYISEPIATSTGDIISRSEAEDSCYEREDEIELAVKDLLDVMLGVEYCTKQIKKIELKKIVEDIVDYLAVKREFPVRRPMIISDDTTGEDVYYEYPYEEFIFEDNES